MMLVCLKQHGKLGLTWIQFRRSISCGGDDGPQWYRSLLLMPAQFAACLGKDRSASPHPLVP